MPERLTAAYAPFADKPVIFGLGPEDIAIGQDGSGPTARVQMLEPLGVETLTYLELGASEVCARLTGGQMPRQGDHVPLKLGMDRMILIDPANDRVIGAES